MRSLGISGEGELRGQPANPGSPGKMAVKTECVCVCQCDKHHALAASGIHSTGNRSAWRMIHSNCTNLSLYCILLQIVKEICVNPSNRNCADCDADGQWFFLYCKMKSTVLFFSLILYCCCCFYYKFIIVHGYFTRLQRVDSMHFPANWVVMLFKFVEYIL